MSPRWWSWLAGEPLAGLGILDVGAGRGRAALALAPRCRRVVALERDPALVEEGRRRAREAGLANVDWLQADAETVEYTPLAPDLIVAHLCMSDAIAERAGRALASGRTFALVAFHTDQWRETGSVSRFAYDEVRMRRVLEGAGFGIERLEVERHVETFESGEAARAAVAPFEARWRADGRRDRYLDFLARGGRTLTRSHLLVQARRR